MKSIRAQTSLEPSPRIARSPRRADPAEPDRPGGPNRIAKARHKPPAVSTAPPLRRADGIHGGGGARRLEGHQGEGTHQLHPRRPGRRILVTPKLPSISSPRANQIAPISIDLDPDLSSLSLPLSCTIDFSPLVFFVCCGSDGLVPSFNLFRFGYSCGVRSGL